VDALFAEEKRIIFPSKTSPQTTPPETDFLPGEVSGYRDERKEFPPDLPWLSFLDPAALKHAAVIDKHGLDFFESNSSDFAVKSLLSIDNPGVVYTFCCNILKILKRS